MKKSSIRVNEQYIQFDDSSQLKQFVEKYSLEEERFEFEFAESVRSGGGEVYIPDSITISESRLEKLDQYDAHNDYYRIKNTKKTLRFYIIHLRKVFANILKKSNHDFLMLLFEGVSGSSIGGIITNALYDPRKKESVEFTLWLLKIYEQDRELFFLLARSGLYALGTAFAVHRRQSFLHRNAFQMGLVCDVNVKKNDMLEKPLINQDQSQQFSYCDEAAQIAQKLRLSHPACEAIKNHMDPNELLELPSEIPVSDTNIFDSIDDSGESHESNESSKEKEKLKHQEALSRALLSIMRLTRYFTDSEKTTTDPEMRLRSLIGGLAYLTEKDLLPKIVVHPILKKCHEFKELISKMKKIAQVEASCLKSDPVSAWAYPKPDATQVICLNNHSDCLNFLSGRPLNVTGLGDASLMRYQKPGEFNKCKLAEKL